MALQLDVKSYSSLLIVVTNNLCYKRYRKKFVFQPNSFIICE